MVQIRDSGGRAFALAGDVTEEEAARLAVEVAMDQLGRLDIAFNNAGSLGEMGHTTGVSADGWRKTIDTNLTSAFFGAR
ncbi:MAG: SDR family NAD(P)-dependent oxidoreductase [Pseudomonadota bacterium]